jgi:hypothetical protein
MRDMLEFVDDVDAVSKIRKLQVTVSLMMKEIYECALFIQEYGRVGLGSTWHQAFLIAAHLTWNTPGRVIRDNISAATDSSIDRFILTFNDLRSKFDRGIAIETLNTVHRLGPLLEDIHAAGKIGYATPLPNGSCVHLL